MTFDFSQEIMGIEFLMVFWFYKKHISWSHEGHFLMAFCLFKAVDLLNKEEE
jgi:hypothetical protein